MGSVRTQNAPFEIQQYKFIKINISSTYAMNVYTHICVQTNKHSICFEAFTVINFNKILSGL